MRKQAREARTKKKFAADRVESWHIVTRSEKSGCEWRDEVLGVRRCTQVQERT